MAQILMYEDKPFSYIASGKGINYDNTISGLTATNIQDAIDEIAQGGSGSGGHTIIDDSGVSQTQRPALKFDGVYTHDDSTNSRTQVDIVREFQSKSAIEALTGEEAKGFQYLDDNQYDAFTAGDIAYDENNSVKDKIDEVVANTEWTYVGRANSLSTTAVTATLSESIENKKELLVLAGYGSYDTAPRYSYLIPISLFKTHGLWMDITNADYYTQSNPPTRNIFQTAYSTGTSIVVTQLTGQGSPALSLFIKFYVR